MNNIDQSYLADLLIQSKESPESSKIKDPMLFEMEIDGKKSYILGTHHATPLCRLPEDCIQHIARCKKLFVEDMHRTEAEKILYRDKFAFIFGKKPHEDWPQKLSAEQQAAIEDIFQKRFSSDHDGDAPKVKASEICFNIVNMFVVESLQEQIYPLLESINGVEHNSADSVCMDHQLQDFFIDAAEGLEPSLYYMQIHAQDPTPYSEQDIKNMIEIAQFVQDLAKLNSAGDNDRTIQYIKDKHPEIYDGLLEGAKEQSALYLEGGYLTDAEITKENDSGDAGESVFVNQARNKEFFKNIVNFSKITEAPLFAIGAMHLIGGDGILSLLDQNGISVKKYCCEENAFVPYHYKYLNSLRKPSLVP